ncbi:MAG: porin family protein [Bdellovibrionaceae bacterium]|nr:porin family protein [Bdellovibrionales bacterium]MCB9253993.1 porin family protein [Pseudobdellovibrionaceae bacterium]
MRNRTCKLILGLFFCLMLLVPGTAKADSWWGAPAESRRMSNEDREAVDQLMKESSESREPKVAMPSVAPVPTRAAAPQLTTAEEEDLRSDDTFAEKIRAATKPIYEQEVLDLIPEQQKSADGFAPPSQTERPEVPVRRSLSSESDGLGMSDITGLGNDHFDRPRRGKKRRVRGRRVRRRRQRAVYEDEFDKMRSYRRKKSRKLRVASREPASSVDASSVENFDPQSAESTPIGFRLALIGGYSGASSTNSAVAQSNQVASQNSFAFGLNADYRGKYLGVELEGYYGLAPEKTQVNGQATFSEFGVLGNVKAHAPLSLGGDARLIPKAGVGFGLIQQNQESITGGGVNVTGNTSVSAPYGIAGVELELGPKLSVFGDYAMSFGGSSNSTQTVGGTPGSSSQMASRFDRIRIGASVEVAKHFRIGGQYINRTLSFGSSLTTTDASEQFMGMLMYDF